MASIGSSHVEKGTASFPCLRRENLSSSAAATILPSTTRAAAGSWKTALTPSTFMACSLPKSARPVQSTCSRLPRANAAKRFRVQIPWCPVPRGRVWRGHGGVNRGSGGWNGRRTGVAGRALTRSGGLRHRGPRVACPGVGFPRVHAFSGGPCLVRRAGRTCGAELEGCSHRPVADTVVAWPRTRARGEPARPRSSEHRCPPRPGSGGTLDLRVWWPVVRGKSSMARPGPRRETVVRFVGVVRGVDRPRGPALALAGAHGRFGTHRDRASRCGVDLPAVAASSVRTGGSVPGGSGVQGPSHRFRRRSRNGRAGRVCGGVCEGFGPGGPYRHRSAGPVGRPCKVAGVWRYGGGPCGDRTRNPFGPSLRSRNSVLVESPRGHRPPRIFVVGAPGC